MSRLRLAFIQSLLLFFAGCEFIEEDSCLDRGGVWDAEFKRCSIDEEEAGQRLDLATVLVVDATALRGKRVTLSGNLVEQSLFCSRYEPGYCLIVDVVGVELGQHVVLSGVFSPPSPNGGKGRLDDTEFISLVQEYEK